MRWHICWYRTGGNLCHLWFRHCHYLSITIFIFIRGQFWHSSIVVACVCESVCLCVCPPDNTSPMQSGITKIRTEDAKHVAQNPCCFWGWWPCKSILTWMSKFHIMTSLFTRVNTQPPDYVFKTACAWESFSYLDHFTVTRSLSSASTYLPRCFTDPTAQSQVSARILI